MSADQRVPNRNASTPSDEQKTKVHWARALLGTWLGRAQVGAGREGRHNLTGANFSE